MIRYVAYTLLVVGLASQTLAEPVNEPYPELARMSTRNILGLHRRDIEGYAPMEQLCGDGDTCAEACGKGFSQCASKDKLTHCYNSAKKQECCPGGTGDACDNGYFCSADDVGKTWCCPDGLSLKECAQKYNIPGPLTSQAPPTSSTSTTKTTTTATTTKATKTKSADSSDAPETSSDSSTATSTRKPATTSTTKIIHHESTSKSESKETTPTTLSSSTTTLLIDVSSALVATAGVTAQNTALDLAPSSTPSTPPASSPTSSIGTNGSGSYGPVNGLVLLVAGALAALI
ncbi:hypothetical protein F4679DRAFT_558784 [Xylaria curta]|nr:hypothetical protein F4679DRAFT_558784 [Xylaria curta]